MQYSGASQSPTAARHTVVLGRNESAGHCVDAPVQYSAGSHGPVEGRQTVELEKVDTVHWDVPLHDCVEQVVLAHVMAVPTQLPLLQVSPYVQRLPSLQLRPSYGAPLQSQESPTHCADAH